MNKLIYIMCGIPCSGKSTRVNRIEDAWYNLLGEIVDVISRDNIREDLYGQKYKINKTREDRVTQVFNTILHNNILNIDSPGVILDNTHCKESYLDYYIKQYGKEHTIMIVFVDISLFKAYYRNVIRWIRTGKFIPFKVIKRMYINYNKINKDKYKEYTHGQYYI